MNVGTVRLVLFAAALVLAGCCGAPPIALVDATYGHEHIVDSRAAHIESMRVVVDEQAASQRGPEVHRFTLRIALDNRHDATWVIARDDVELVVGQYRGNRCPSGIQIRIAFQEDVMVTLAAHTSATLTLPIEIRVFAPNTLYELERFPIDLHLYDGSNELLHRRLAIGMFDQVGQGIRLVAVLTAALLVVSIF
jgi:hypothetical protein